MPLGANKAAIMGVAGVSTGDVVLLSTQTADGDASISFTSGIDSTYGEYIFKFYNINPGTNNSGFTFQGSIDGGSNYNVTMTTTHFHAHHQEDGTDGAISYTADKDQAQGTAFQTLTADTCSDADASAVGELHLFNPSSTTYVKHFYATSQTMNGDTVRFSEQQFIGGYFNTTDNIDAIQFKIDAGVFDGKIKMWGVK
jgi:hypothetical protein